MKKSLLIISFLLSLSASAQIYVDASATGANNGSSWTDAYTDINLALQNRTSNDYWVAAGTYKPNTSNGSSINLLNDQKIYGGFNGSETSVGQRNFRNNITILSGDQLDNDLNNGLTYNASDRSDNNYRILRVVGTGVEIDGFTIQDGSAEGNSQGLKEGAAGILNNDTIVRNCIVKNNVTNRGGAFVAPQSNFNGTVVFENVNFNNNLASFAPAFYGTGSISQSYRFINVEFTENTSGNASGVTGFGGVLWLRHDSSNANLTMVNCTIADNDYQNTNGGNANLRISSGGTPECKIQNSIFWNNGVNYKALDFSSTQTVFNVDRNIDPDNFSNLASATGTQISDPFFTDAANDDYTITSNSPAVDSGNSNYYLTNFPIDDLLGNPRLQGNSIDLGCYESGSTVSAIAYVNQNATGNNDGSSWADAFTNLQNAINSGSPEVWVKSDTYKPLAGINESITVNRVKNIYGGFTGTETSLNQRNFRNNLTRLSGDQLGNDTAVPSYSGTDRNDNNRIVLKVNVPGVLLDGFYVSGGNADLISNGNGSGALINKDMVINNCVFENNISYRNAVIAVQSASPNAAFRCQNTIIKNNLTGSVSAFWDGVSESGATTFVNTLIVDNTSQNNSEFAGTSSGVVWINAGTSGTCDLEFLNSTVANNTYLNPIVGNGNANIRTYGRGPIASLYNYYNSIFYGNSAPAQLFNDGPRTFDIQNCFSDSGFGIAGTNTLTGNPLFVDASNDDYRLQSTSTAINAGANSLYDSQWLPYDLDGNNRIANTTIDMGAYEFGSTAGIEEVNQFSISLYPNPVTRILNVTVGNDAFAKAEIFNLQGQQIAISNTEEIEVHELETGMYIIKITTQSGVIASQQFIKK